MEYIKKYDRFLNESQPYVAPILLSLENNVDKSLMNDIESVSKPGDKILEISSGNGADSKYLKDAGYNIICTELNDEYVKKCKSLGLNCIKNDTEKGFPFGDKEFDVTYSRLGLHYFSKEKLSFIFDDIARITKGYLIFSVKLSDDIPTGKVILSEEEWKEVLLGKFKIVSSTKKSGKLYGSNSNWIEIISKVL